MAQSLHYTTLHYGIVKKSRVQSTLHFSTHYHITIQDSPLHCTLIHYTSQQYTKLHFTTKEYFTSAIDICACGQKTTLLYNTLHYITKHCTHLEKTNSMNSTEFNILKDFPQFFPLAKFGSLNMQIKNNFKNLIFIANK